MPELQIRLLGTFELIWEGQPVAIDHVRLQSLLAYFVLHREASHPRRRLSYLFWPESSESQARANLRRNLYQLHQAWPDIDQVLEINHRQVRWRFEGLIALDVAGFETPLAQAARAQRSDPQMNVAALQQAVTLYQGDLLPDCYDEWVLTERARLRSQYLGGLEQLASILEQQQRYDAALEYAQRLVRSDPLHEAGYRLLMRLHLVKGERTRALRVYQECVDILRSELDVEPDNATQALYQRLLETTDGSSAGREPPPMARRDTLPLVGRRTAWEQLQHAWDRAVLREPCFVLISGESGIGKTRLLEEMLAWAEQQGHSYANTRAYAAEGRQSYAPIVEWLRSDVVSHHLTRLEPIWLTEGARLLPELLLAHPHVPPPQPMADSWQRQRFREALARVLLTSASPLLLTIDDLQWCDAETLEFLHLLLRYDESAQLLIVGTVRSEEMVGDDAVSRLAVTLRRDGRLAEIALGLLDVRQTAVLAAQITGRTFDEQLAKTLYAETQGHPLFIVETLRAQAEHSTHDAEGQKIAVTPKVQAVIESRLGQLGMTARAVVDVAAVIGRAFDLSLLRQIAAIGGEVDEVALHAALDETWQRRVLRVEGAHAYDFSHDKIREVVLDQMSPVRRRVLHEQVAQALERIHADGIDRVSGEIAAHYERAGLVQQAIGYYRQAADAATRVLAAYAEAESSLRRGLELVAMLEHTVKRDKEELDLRISLAQAMSVPYGMHSLKVHEIYEQALHLADSIGDDRLRYEALRGRLLYHLILNQCLEAYEAAKDKLSLAEKLDEPSYLSDAYGGMGVVLQRFGRFTEARNSLERALHLRPTDLFESGVRYSVQHTGVIWRYALAAAMWRLGYPDQALSHVMNACSLARNSNHPFSLANALLNLGNIHLQRGELGAAKHSLEASFAITEKYQFAPVHPQRMISLGYVSVLEGEVNEGISRIHEGMALKQKSGSHAHEPLYLSYLAEAYLLAGDTTQGLRAIDEAIEVSKRFNDQTIDVEIHRLKGELLMAGGRTDEAQASLDYALSIARRQEAKSLELRAVMSLAQMWHLQGRRAEAHALLAPIYAWFTEGFDTLDLRNAQLLLNDLSNSLP